MKKILLQWVLLEVWGWTSHEGHAGGDLRDTHGGVEFKTQGSSRIDKLDEATANTKARFQETL